MFYNYNTPIYARVHSKKLGLLRWTFSGLILAYIVFYSMLYKGGYLKEEAPIGTVRFSVQHTGTHQPFSKEFNSTVGRFRAVVGAPLDGLAGSLAIHQRPVRQQTLRSTESWLLTKTP